ncbi:MAG: hypothetical protein ABJN72_05290 [Sulfitobacter sp.]
MITVTIGWIGFFAVVGATIAVMFIYLRTRSLSNRLLSVAANEFFESVSSLLETGDELPDTVIETIEIMNSSAHNAGSHWALLKAVKQKHHGKPNPSIGDTQRFKSDFDTLRPELQKLFSKAVVAWLNYLTHQNIYTMGRIGYTVLSQRSNGLEHSKAETVVGLNFLQNIRPNAC